MTIEEKNKKREELRPLYNGLNRAANIEILIFSILLIASIWSDNHWVNKAILTDIVLFIFTMFYYVITCHETFKD